jgi:CelD/BcsL family acetyltransferase involved in cellulose biosynthesis
MFARRLRIVPPVAPGSILRPPLRRIALPLGAPHCHQLARATDALCIGARAIGLRDGDELLVPQRYDEAVLRALRGAGLVVRSYPASALLEPDAAQLEPLLGASVRALCLVHHLGFPQDAGRWRAWCDEHGLALIEDATRAFGAASAGRPVGSLADAAVFGLAECLGTPDGAVLRLGSELVDGTPSPRASALTSRLLWRLGDERVAAARRAHYAELLERLGDAVPAPFDRLVAGAAPFALPVRSPAVAQLGPRLARHGITTQAGWPAPPGAILLPVHQQLRPADLTRIAAATLGSRPRPRRDELSLEPLGSFDALPEEWPRLAAAGGSIFATPQWLRTWSAHHGRERALRLYACRDRSGRLAAILPLEVRSVGPVAVMRFAGHGPSDELGPVCAPADRPGDAGWEALLGARTLASEGSPIAHLDPAGWEAQLRRWTPSVGRLLGRRTRKLEREHEVRTRRTTDAQQLDRDLDVLFELHDARWPGGTAFSRRDRALHREFAALALDCGWLQLSFLEVDGEDVAAVYNLRFAGAELQYQQGRLPAWDGASVGTIALLRSIRQACDEGMSEFRFLRGEEDYKYRYADADPGLRTVAVARGRGAAGALAVASAIPPNLLKPARRWVPAA